MKTKLLIVGMLLLSLVVLSGCNVEWKIATKKCLKETAEEFCKERDCVVKKIYYGDFLESNRFIILEGEWREQKRIYFTDGEIESCQNIVEI